MTRLEQIHAVTVPLDPALSKQIEARAFAIYAHAAARGHAVLIESPRRLVVGLGTAARVRLQLDSTGEHSAREVTQRLGAVPCADPIGRPGSRATAFGAIPFDPSAEGELIVPELTMVFESDGTSWTTLAGRGDLELGPLLEQYDAQDMGSGRQAVAASNARVDYGDDSQFLGAVETALGEIASRRIQKVVLSRRISAEFDQPVSVRATLESLRLRETSSTIFAVTSSSGTFLGASPELLVARHGRRVRSVPLAGTVRTTGDPALDDSAVGRMVASTKENAEHRVVAESVASVLEEFCGPIDVPSEPQVLWLRQIAHLATHLSGTLGGEEPDWPGVLELLAALHPTPAVGGFPTAAALDLIAKLEPEGRSLYAGPVGWVDSRGNGEFVIGIRSAEVQGSSAVLHAGAGVVKGSDPERELAEIALKAETMLGALAAG